MCHVGLCSYLCLVLELGQCKLAWITLRKNQKKKEESHDGVSVVELQNLFAPLSQALSDAGLIGVL